MYDIISLFPIFNNGFGVFSVKGRSLSPLPPAIITASIGKIDFISENWNDAFFMMLQKEHNLRVRLLYKEVYNYKIFGVENTRPMSRTEKNRITDIIKRIGKQRNIEDFLRHYGEKGEGGGMGIYIIIAYLKKMGLSYRSLFYTFSPSTIAYLIFPNTNPKIGIQKLIPSYIIE